MSLTAVILTSPYEFPLLGPSSTGHPGRRDRGPGAYRPLRPESHGQGRLSAPERPDDLCRPALRRDGGRPDGRLPDVLLRIPLSVHHRHRARRIQEHPGSGDHEAAVPPRHGHVAGHERDGRLREPCARHDAARHRTSVRHAFRRRERADRSARLRKRDPHRRAVAGRRAEYSPSAVRHLARRLRAAALRWQRAQYPRQSHPGPPPQHRGHAGGSRRRPRRSERHHPGWKPHARRPEPARSRQLHRQEHQGPRERLDTSRPEPRDPDPRRSPGCRRRRRRDQLRLGRRSPHRLHPCHQAF